MGWYNTDGLYVKFGVEEGTAGVNGEYVYDGPQRLQELTIYGTGVSTAPTQPLDYGDELPKGSVIERVELVVQTAFVGAGTLSLGGWNAVTNVLDSSTGVLNAITNAILTTLGTTEIYKATTGSGGYFDTATAALLNYVATGSTAFTGGVAQVRIFYQQTPVVQ